MSRFTRIAGRRHRHRPCRRDTTESTFSTNFNDLGLTDAIARTPTEEKYLTPTPIQAQTIPTVMSGRDVIGIAGPEPQDRGLCIADLASPRCRIRGRGLRKSCRVLVLSPTRELSGQILDSFRVYGRHLRVSTALAIGGVPMGKQVRALADGVDVLVATPGRLLDLVQGNALRLGGESEYLRLG